MQGHLHGGNGAGDSSGDSLWQSARTSYRTEPEEPSTQHSTPAATPGHPVSAGGWRPTGPRQASSAGDRRSGSWDHGAEQHPHPRHRPACSPRETGDSHLTSPGQWLHNPACPQSRKCVPRTRLRLPACPPRGKGAHAPTETVLAEPRLERHRRHRSSVPPSPSRASGLLSLVAAFTDAVLHDQKA